MPHSKKQKHSAKKRQKTPSRISRERRQTFDYYKFFTVVLQLQDGHSFPERDDWTRTFLSLQNKHTSSDQASRHSNQENHVREYLMCRYFWLDAGSDLCPGANIVGIQQCRNLLRASGRRLAQLVEWMSMKLCVTRRQFGSHCPSNGARLEKFPEEIKPHLLSFETTHKVDAAISHMLCSDAILFLEGFLVTCLSIPTLRPLFLPLAESKVVHVVSKILDNLLGLDSLERTIPEINPADTSAETVSERLTAMETIEICTMVLAAFVSDSTADADSHLYDVSESSQHLVNIETRTKEFAKMFREMVGTGPKRYAMDTTVKRNFFELKAGPVLSSLLYYTRPGENAAGQWGNLQDDTEFQKFLQNSVTFCDCSETSAELTCQKCLSRLQAVLESFLDRFAVINQMLNDTRNIFEEILSCVQRNTRTDCSEQDVYRSYHEYMLLIRISTNRRLTDFLLSHLLRMARLTSNFTKNIESPNAAKHCMEMLCMSLYRFHAATEIMTNSYREYDRMRAASTFLRNTLLKAVEDDILLLKTLQRYIRDERVVVGQRLARKERKAEAEDTEDRPESPSLDTIIAQLMDEIESVIEVYTLVM